LKSFGIFSARIVALVFATSAGFIAYSHFLTSDIPVMFWMLLAFYFSINILTRAKLSDYLLAGFFTGIATATKYNGLAIGISIAVAHFLSCSSNSWKTYRLEAVVF
jgi:4-amino-4-deoxy-L-arabinose transferase-like glycosyltransferase